MVRFGVEGAPSTHSLSQQRHAKRQHAVIRHQNDLLSPSHVASIRGWRLLPRIHRWRGQLSRVHWHRGLAVRGKRRVPVISLCPCIRRRIRVPKAATSVVRRERASRHARICLLQGGRRVGKQAPQVVALDDLRHRACLDVANLHECRLEREHVRVLECYRCMRRLHTNAEMHVNSPKLVGAPSQKTKKFFRDLRPPRLM